MIRLQKHLATAWPIWLITLTFLVLATAYNTINPLHEGTDELRHYRFVRYIIQNRELPVQGQEACRSQSHHPPLFYVLGAAVTASIDTGRDVCAPITDNPFWAYRYWEVGTDNKNMFLHDASESFPWQGEARAAHLIRGLNTILGAITVVLTYLTARLMWPRQRGYAAGSASIVAFSPMFLYMSGTINNDVIAAMSGALVIYTAVRLTHAPRGVTSPLNWGLALGYVYTIALMSKFSLAPFAVILLFALFIVTHRRNQFRQWWLTSIIMGITTVALAGWWFVRNYLIFGDPTGFQEVTQLWGVRTPADSWGLVWLELPNVWSSFWGRFGFGQIPLEDNVYYTLWIITLLSLGGALLWCGEKIMVWSHHRREPLIWHKDKNLFISLWIMLLTCAIAFVVVVAYMLVSPAGAMGRFLFPGLPAFAILLFWGLTRWLQLLRQTFNIKRPSGTIARFSYFIAIGMFLFGTVALVNYLAPAYAQPAAWTTRPSENTAAEATFTFATLDSYHLSQTTINPGDEIDITLYWDVQSQPPGDYFFFVHLINDLGEIVAQRDTHPATGKFPASHWQAGDKFVDSITLVIPETAYPTTAALTIGFYAPEGYRLPITADNGESLGDTYHLDDLEIASNGDCEDTPLNYNFEDRVQLVGYQYDQRDSTNGEPIILTLYWEAKPETFATIEDLNVVVATQWGETTSPIYTNITKTAQHWVTEHQITPPPDSSDAALSAVNVRLFDIFTDQQLNTIARRGNWIDNEVHLAAVRFANPQP